MHPALFSALVACGGDGQGVWLRGVGHLSAPDRAPVEDGRWDQATLRVPVESVAIAYARDADCEDWDAGSVETKWIRVDDPPQRVDLVYLEQEDALLGEVDLDPGIVTAVRVVPVERPLTYVGPYRMEIPVAAPSAGEDGFLATGCVPVGDDDAEEVIARLDLARSLDFDALRLHPVMDLVGEDH